MSHLQANSLASDPEAVKCELETSTMCQGLPHSERDVASLFPRAPIFIGKIDKYISHTGYQMKCMIKVGRCF